MRGWLNLAMLVNLLMQNYLYGRYRWPWISDLYEYIQTIYLLPAILSVMANPKRPTFKVTSKGDTHINKKYPTRLTVNPPEGVSVKKTRQTATDAVKLSDSTLEFQVAFEADEPGTKTIKGELRFATCKGEESCQQYTKRISFDVDVK